jgi:putative phage-type endonuclease
VTAGSGDRTPVRVGPPRSPVGHARAVVETDALTRAEWVAARKMGLGGSDAAAVCGLDRWRSPFAVWLDKTGMLDDADEASEAASWGHLLEPVIADEVARREQVDVTRVGWMLGHPDHHFMLANVDRLVVDPRLGPDAGVFEIKTTSPFNALDWRDGIPVPAMCQVQHYLGVTGLRWALVAALIGGQRLITHVVEADDDLIASIIDVEAVFWSHVIDREPPAPDGSASTSALLGRLYDVETDAVRAIDRAEIEPALAALHFARTRQDDAEADRRAAENEIKVVMGGAEMLTDAAGEPIARWPSVETARVDVAALRRDHPTLAAQYTTTTTSRRFTIVKR